MTKNTRARVLRVVALSFSCRKPRSRPGQLAAGWQFASQNADFQDDLVDVGFPS